MSLREQFEAWYRNQFLYVSDSDFKRDKNKPDNYEVTKVWDHWDAFQAGHAAAGKVVKPLVSACSEALANDEVSEGFGARNMEDDLRQILAKAIEDGEAFMKGHGDVAGD